MFYIIHLTLCVLYLSASSLHLCHQYILCTESYILHLYASIHLTLYTCWPQHSSMKLILYPADALGGRLTSYIADAQGGRLTSYISILQWYWTMWISSPCAAIYLSHIVLLTAQSFSFKLDFSTYNYNLWEKKCISFVDFAGCRGIM